MELIIGGENLAFLNSGVGAAEVCDEASGLADQKQAGGDVPELKVFLPEAVIAAGGDPGEIERRRSEASDSGDLRGDFVEDLLEAVEMAMALIGHAGGDQGVRKVPARRDP